jgi:hypothetical protein
MSNNFNVFYAGLIKLIFNSVKLLAWQLITSNFLHKCFCFICFYLCYMCGMYGVRILDSMSSF